MKVQSCKSSGSSVSTSIFNECTFEIIDEWHPEEHAKTCDTMFYLQDGSGAYVWSCDDWLFLDFTGGKKGPQGKSAYEVAVDNGFEGTVVEWLASLKGDPGQPGEDGRDAHLFIAYSWSADGDDRFTIPYPNENLALGTQFKTEDDWGLIWRPSDGVKELTEDGFKLTSTTGTQTGMGQAISKQLKYGDIVTISFLYRGTGTAEAYFLMNSGGNLAISFETSKSPTEWQLYSKSYTFPNNAAGIRDFSIMTRGLDNWIEVKKESVKIEFGDERSAYTPSPSEDFDGAYPRYLGTYVTLEENQSTNPADYTWARIRGKENAMGYAEEVQTGIALTQNYMAIDGVKWSIVLNKSVGIENTDITLTNRIGGVKSTITPIDLQVFLKNNYTIIEAQLANTSSEIMGHIEASIILDTDTIDTGGITIVNPIYHNDSIGQYFTGINTVDGDSSKIGWFFTKKKMIDLTAAGLNFYANGDIALAPVAVSENEMYFDLSSLPEGINYLSGVIDSAVLVSQVFTKI